MHYGIVKACDATIFVVESISSRLLPACTTLCFSQVYTVLTQMQQLSAAANIRHPENMT